MHLLAAEIAPSFTPGQLAAALGILAFLVSLALALKKLFGHEPPLHKEYVTRIEVAKLEKDLKDDLTKGAVSRKDMHRDIEGLRIGQAKLEAETASQTRQLHQLDSKIENLPEKILRLMDRHKS